MLLVFNVCISLVLKFVYLLVRTLVSYTQCHKGCVVQSQRCYDVSRHVEVHDMQDVITSRACASNSESALTWSWSSQSVRIIL